MPRAGRSLALVCLAPIFAAGCAKEPAKSPPAAEKPKVEADLSRTTLPADAVKSLGIETRPAEGRPVQEHVMLTGWVMAKQGHEVVVTAEVAGHVREPKPEPLPVAGSGVKSGAKLLVIDPVLSPLDQLQVAERKRTVEGELANAVERVTVARQERDRIKDLLPQKLRSQQDFEQAEAKLKQAEVDEAAARDRLKLYSDEKGAARLKPRDVEAPRDGTVLVVHASPGQYVPAGAPLITLIDMKGEVWVRVPVPEHELPRVHAKEAATILLDTKPAGTLVDPKGGPRRLNAEPVTLLPQVDLSRHTADLIYRLPASESRPRLAKDQTVTVLVPLGEKRNEVVVPYTAVVFDAYGGAWIYLDKTPKDGGERVYERQRVELGPAQDADVVVRVGDDKATRAFLEGKPQVVTAGAAELFSREFHRPPVAKK